MVRPNDEIVKKLPLAIELVRKTDLVELRKQFKTPPLDVVGQLIRSVFVAKPGHKFVICDLSAIENRGLGYVAEDETILEVFRKKLDPYLNFASKMYQVPYDSIVVVNEKGEHKAKDGAAKEKRQNAKPAVLGCGYMLSGGEEIITDEGDKIFTGLMGYGRAMGVPLSKELADLSVQTFRDTHLGVVRCWRRLEDSAMLCIRTGRPQEVGPIRFEMTKSVLRMVLPSGRSLHYLEPKIVEREWFGGKKKTIECWGIDQKKHIWTRIYTYGGKLIENAVQAISRDILVEGMFNATEMGFSIVMHCHDEIVAEVPEASSLGISDLKECMIRPPRWGNHQLLIDAAGFESKVYKKE